MSNRDEIKKIYLLIKGTYQGIKEAGYELVQESTYKQYNYLLGKIYKLTEDEYIPMLEIKNNEIGNYHGEERCTRHLFLTKIVPVMEYIHNIYIDTTEETIKKVGALYNAIEDSELQKRCGDILLEATGKFDRVINQATQVLEDRIKKKAGLDKTTLIGLPLVSKAIHSKIENTIIIFSENADIQEQYSALFKGVIGVYRNSTHHGTEYECTREDSLKFCAYIDMLLKEIENSNVVD